MSRSDSSDSNVDLEKQAPNLRHDEDLIELPKILKESITGFGGFGALLLQIAHPGAARGVHNHSEFATRQLDRAEKTAIYVYMMVYGTQEEKNFIREWVNRMHSRVKGGEGDSAYRAQDPDLQLWVAATLYVGWVKSYEMAYGPLPADRAERVYQEFSVFGTSLQVPREKWPQDRHTFNEYYEHIVQNEQNLVPEGEQVFYHIMHPRLPFVFKPLVPLALYLTRIFSVDYLPPRVRLAYGLKSTTKFDRFNRKLMILQYKITPPFIRSLPKRYYMKRGRVMVAKLKQRGFNGDMRMRSH
ncbi:oxygenase MpaB family protein [Aspergillus lucknowensis]|uniref:ER-bound oxygenase mpaB/mpaB'/Rubber oxygenase catalytic domain-containing protein n=1 Tax=Aspergillus lucknowensis TaxID=176173 RepID=A0ABR4LL31_9EURO